MFLVRSLDLFTKGAKCTEGTFNFNRFIVRINVLVFYVTDVYAHL